MILWKY